MADGERTHGRSSSRYSHSKRSRSLSMDLTKAMKQQKRNETRINLVPDFSQEHLISHELIKEAWEKFNPRKARINYLDFRGACYYCKLQSREQDLLDIFHKVDIHREREIDFRKFTIAIQQQNQLDLKRLMDVDHKLELSEGFRHPSHPFLLYLEPQKERWKCSGEHLPGGCLHGDPDIRTVKIQCYASRKQQGFKLCSACFADKTRKGAVAFDPKNFIEDMRAMIADHPDFKDLKNAETEKIVEATFKKFDTDRSGLIDPDEFRAASAWVGMELTDDELKKTFEFIDADGSNEIDLEEYKQAFLSSGVVQLDHENGESEERSFDGDNYGGPLRSEMFMDQGEMTNEDFEQVKSTFSTMYTTQRAGHVPEEFTPMVRDPEAGEEIEFRYEGSWINATIIEQLGDRTVILGSPLFEHDLPVHWNDPRIKLSDDGNQIALALRMFNDRASLESIADAMGLDGDNEANQFQMQIFCNAQKQKEKIIQMQNDKLRAEVLGNYNFVTSDMEDFLSDVEDTEHILGGERLPDDFRHQDLSIGSLVMAQPNPHTPYVWEKMRVVHMRSVVALDDDDESETSNEVYLLPVDWKPSAGKEAYKHILEERKRMKKKLEKSERSSSRMSVLSLSSYASSMSAYDNYDRSTKSGAIVQINPLNKTFTFTAKTRFPNSVLKLRKESSRMKPIPTERLKNDAELWLQDQKRIKMYIPFEDLLQQFPDLERDDLEKIYKHHEGAFRSFQPLSGHIASDEGYRGKVEKKFLQVITNRNGIAVAASKNGIMVSASHDRTVRLWRKKDQEAQCFSSLYCKSGVLSCDITQDGSLLAAGCFGRTCEIWDPRRAIRVGEINTCWSCPAVEFHPTGTKIAVSNGSGDNVLRLWDLHVLRPAVSIIGFKYEVADMSLHKFGDLLLTASKNKTYVFDLRARKPVLQQRSNERMLNAVAWHDIKDSVYTILDKDRIRLYDMRNDSEAVFDWRFKLNRFRARQNENPRPNYTTCFASFGEHHAVGFSDGRIDVIDFEELNSSESYEASLTQPRLEKRMLHTRAVSSIAFSGTSVFSGSADQKTNLIPEAILDVTEANEATIEV